MFSISRCGWVLCYLNMRLQWPFVLSLPGAQHERQLPTAFMLQVYAWITIPLISSLVAFVLIIVALSSGTGSHSQQQDLEQYHIFAVNLSTSVQSIFAEDPNAITSSILNRGLGGWVDGLRGNGTSWVDGLRGNATSWLDGLIDDAGKLIPQWYSIHLRSYCQGSFSNYADSRTRWNVTRCVDLGSGDSFGHSEAIGRLYKQISRYLFRITLVYAIGGTLCILSDIAGLAAWVLYREQKLWQYRPVVMVHLIVAVSACAFLFAGTVIVTVITSETCSLVENLSKLGITADNGSNFLGLSWAASVLALLSCFVLVPFYYYWYRVSLARLG
ncbi:hypothetical protein F4679DRAFT_544235 [Xylaria curta]|nr:hypothetical protein F4679DRAFT_544235 [Xylaria curta]